MPREESLQHWIDRNRPPRVQITYDVETLGAIEKKELPFVVGILADLWGGTANEDEHGPLSKTFKKRSFTEIDRDTFGQFMKKAAPSVDLKVADTLADQPTDGTPGPTINVPLAFASIDDFRPERIVDQIRESDHESLKDLRELFDARQELAELLARADVKDQIHDQLLAKVVAKTGAGGDAEKAPAKGKPDKDAGKG